MKTEVQPDTELVPLPVVLVTTGEGQTANIITIAWVGIVNSTPPMISLAVRPSRHSYSLLSATREFVVNIPRVADVDKVDIIGAASGRDVFKFAEMGFTALAASKVGAPLIAQCPINLECQLRHQLSLGSHDLFVGQIVAAHYDEEVLDSRGRLKPSAEVGLLLVGDEYWSLGQKVAGFGAAGKAWRAARRGAPPFEA